MSKELCSGYTTGTHATAVLGAVLREFYENQISSLIDVSLEKSKDAKIEVKKESQYHFSTIKVDNDDLDVTKGCCIHSQLFLEIPKDLVNFCSNLLLTDFVVIATIGYHVSCYVTHFFTAFSIV